MRWAAFLLCGGFACALAAQSGIETRNHRALSLLFLRFAPVQQRLAAGEVEWRHSYTNGNDFRIAKKGELEEDYEVSRFLIGYRQGLPDGELFVEAPVVLRSGGFMDPIIDWFHRLLGFPPQPRDEFPNGRSVMRSGEIEGGSAFGLGDVSAGYRLDPAQNLSLRFAIELPTGNTRELLGSGGMDIGASLDWLLPLTEGWTLAAQAALILQGGGAVPGVQRSVEQFALSIIWTPNTRDAWVLQWQGEAAPVVTGFTQADGPHRLLTLGYRRSLGPGETLEVFFSEDGDFLNWRAPALVNIGPDFTFGVAYRSRR